jgi:hypothetical protein
MSDNKSRPMDEPDIDARQFLSRVMHEPTVDLKDRMSAADILLQLGLGNYREEEVHITIRGGISHSPRLEDLSLEMQREHLWGKRRNGLRSIDPVIAYWDVKGHG